MSIRRGIPHLLPPKATSPSITDGQVRALLEPGYISLINVTEKTDGQTFIIGFDADGFYTQSSGSGKEKMREGVDYVKRAEERNNNLKVANAFKIFHDHLGDNYKLLDWLQITQRLTNKDVILRGEVFNNLLAKTEGNLIKYIHTPYDPKFFGNTGAFILHTKMNEICPYPLETCSNYEIVFDTDGCSHFFNVDVSTLRDSRMDTTTIRNDLFLILSEMLSRLIKPKWGPFTEGYIFHSTSPNIPTFKVISDYFTKARETTSWAEISA